MSQLASADRADLAVGATDEPSDETVPPVDDEASDESSDAPEDDSTSDETGEPDDTDEPGDTDGRIVIDTGDGEPIEIDLGDIEGEVGRLTECIGVPMFDLDVGGREPGEFGEFPIDDLEEFLDGLPFDLETLDDGEWGSLDFGQFGVDGDSVTVAGPDGVSVVDLGENGSVTVTKDGGDLTISTGGDATVSELDELFGDFGGDMGLDGLFDELFESLPNLDESGFPDLDELPAIESLDPDAVQRCLDDVLGR